MAERTFGRRAGGVDGGGFDRGAGGRLVPGGTCRRPVILWPVPLEPTCLPDVLWDPVPRRGVVPACDSAECPVPDAFSLRPGPLLPLSRPDGVLATAPDRAAERGAPAASGTRGGAEIEASEVGSSGKAVDVGAADAKSRPDAAVVRRFFADPPGPGIEIPTCAATSWTAAWIAPGKAPVAAAAVPAETSAPTTAAAAALRFFLRRRPRVGRESMEGRVSISWTSAARARGSTHDSSDSRPRRITPMSCATSS
jgi:hypothetical protein